MKSKITEYLLESIRPRYVEPISVKGSFLFLSDVEIPFHNYEFLNKCIAVARAYGVKQVVLGGDLLHMEAFSPFPGNDNNADEELLSIEEYLPGLLEPFTKIHYFMGNHDQRLQRNLFAKISNERVLKVAIPQKLFDRINFSEYFWCEAEDWLLEHQKNNSMAPTGVAQAMVKKYSRNVITAHTHKAGMVRLNDYWAIDSGCCVDIDRLAYTNIRHSTHTKMENGAVLMLWQNGYKPILLTPDLLELELWRAKQGRAQQRRAKRKY